MLKVRPLLDQVLFSLLFTLVNLSNDEKSIHYGSLSIVDWHLYVGKK